MSADVKQYMEKVIKFGTQHAEYLAEWYDKDPIDNALAPLYYDGTHNFYTISDLTGDAKWKVDATRAFHVYGVRNVFDKHGQIPAYWIFPHGILRHYQENKRFWDGQDPQRTDARQAHADLGYLVDAGFSNWAVGGAKTWPETEGGDLRQLAYAVMSYICLWVGQGEDEQDGRSRIFSLGNGDLNDKRMLRFHVLSEQLLNLVTWYTKYNKWDAFLPYMGGLAARALIERDEFFNTYTDWGSDPRTLPSVKSICEHAMNVCWHEPTQSFLYCNVNEGNFSRDPAPDLNLLIAPAYAWLHKQSKMKTSQWLDKHDKIFNGGISNAFMANGKQFNQQVYWSKRGLEWSDQLPK